MRTRKAAYLSPSDGITFIIRPKFMAQKRRKVCSQVETPSSVSASFDSLHDELLLSVMVSLSSSAAAPRDIINAMLVCKRFCAAGAHPLVLGSVSAPALTASANKWSDGAHRFLKKCADAGNEEAAYTLGMIHFYCFNEREAGVSLMAQAAVKPHAPALYSLGIIQFNGSGATRKDKNLKNGASLSAKAAGLAHIDALRELGHCLQDGYGVQKNVHEGRRLLLEANAREAAAAVAASPHKFLETALQIGHRHHHNHHHHHHHHHNGSHRSAAAAAILEAEAMDQVAIPTAIQSLGQPAVVLGGQGGGEDVSASPSLKRHPVYQLLHGGGSSLLSEFGCKVPPPKLHIANKFLVDWFSLHPPPVGLRLCSHANCGRPETRRHEFRRCSACGAVHYCSRACQAMDWKLRHKNHCLPIAEWEDRDDNDDQEDDDEDDDEEENAAGQNT